MSLSKYKNPCDLDRDLKQTAFILLIQNFLLVVYVSTGRRNKFANLKISIVISLFQCKTGSSPTWSKMNPLPSPSTSSNSSGELTFFIGSDISSPTATVGPISSSQSVRPTSSSAPQPPPQPQHTAVLGRRGCSRTVVPLHIRDSGPRQGSHRYHSHCNHLHQCHSHYNWRHSHHTTPTYSSSWADKVAAKQWGRSTS